MGDILKGYLNVKYSGHSRLTRKAWRKRWLVMEFPSCKGSTPEGSTTSSQSSGVPAGVPHTGANGIPTPGDSTKGEEDFARSISSILVRIYTSHVHENRGPPVICLQVLDIHGLHRVQSRSQPYAFSVDGSSGELVAAGGSETESQHWIRSIRTRIWKPNNVNRTGFPVSLVDNIHSDVARLRGFYGHLDIDREEGEIVLIEERSGAEQVRWSLESMNRVFCPKTVSKKDREKILVIITKRRSKSIGQGIFTLYSEDAKSIQEYIQEFMKLDADRRKNAGTGGLSCVPGVGGKSKNPLSFLFKSGGGNSNSSNNGGGNSNNNDVTGGGGGGGGGKGENIGEDKMKRDRGRRKVLEKSKSMMDRFVPVDSTASPRPLPPPGDLKLPTCDNVRATPTPPPYPSPGGAPSPPEDQPISNLLQEGNYYRFDKEPKYEPCMPSQQQQSQDHPGGARNMEDPAGARNLDEDRIDDALLQLQSIERSLLELSQHTLQPQDIRSSYISVDSGRSSDTYAETSASSITSSSTNHSNRLNSNASNCSADSGTDLSIGEVQNQGKGVNNVGDPSLQRPMLVRTNMQENPYACIKRNKDKLNPIYGRVGNDQEPVYDRRLPQEPVYGNRLSQEPVYGTRLPSEPVYGTRMPTAEPVYGRVTGKQGGTGSRAASTSSSSRQQQLLPGTNPAAPPALPPRFATIRKSLTLPHNISSYQKGEGGGEEKAENFKHTLDNKTFDSHRRRASQRSGAGLHDETYENFTFNEHKDRPASLRLENRKCLPEASNDSSTPKLRKASTLKNRTLDKMRTPGDMDNTLERIRVGDMDLYSVPNTPVFDALRMINPMKYSDNSSMKRTSITGTLAKSTKKSPTIFNSTPDNLDSFNSTEYGVMGWPGSNNELNGWQSSDGLTTPISISGRSPLHTPGYTPLHTPLRTLYSLMHPPSTPSMGGHQGTPSTPSARTARIRKSSFRGSDSMFIFRDVSGTSSPRKVTTPTPGGRSGQGSQNLSGNKYRRFHSVPRSSTIDGIVDSSSSPRHNGVEHQGMIYSTNERTVQMHYSIPATNSSVPNSKSLDNLSSRGSPVGHYLNMGRVASKQSIDGGSNNNSRQQSTETLHKIGGGGGENGLPNPAGVQWTPPGKTLYRQHYAPGPGLMQRSSTTVGFLEGYSKKYDIYGGVNGVVRKQASDYGVVPPLRQSSVRQTTVNMGQVTPSRQTQSGILGFSASKVPNGGGSSDYLNMQNLLKTKD